MTRRSLLLSPAAFAAPARLPSAERQQFIVAMLTMLDSKAQLDDALNGEYLRFLAEGGADGVLVMGTTGEFASFSLAERKRALESTLKHRGKLGVMAQIGAPSIPETLDLLEHATKSGADSVLVLPPYYYKNPSVEGLAAFFEPIFKAANLPVLVYNIPQLSGAPITPDLLRRLASHPRLYGMKDSFSKSDAMLGFLKDFPALKIMTGVPANLAANLQNAGAGGLTGNGSIFLKETTAVFRAHREGGDVVTAQNRLNKVSSILSGYDGVPAMKFLLGRLGLKESGLRPPFVPLTDAARKALIDRWSTEVSSARSSSGA